MVLISKIEKIIKLLCTSRMNLATESNLQADIAGVFLKNDIQFKKEYSFDKKNRVDFFCDGIAIEIKIGGKVRSILSQCERYCSFEETKALILVTNRAIGFPAEINGKSVYVVKVGQAWL